MTKTQSAETGSHSGRKSESGQRPERRNRDLEVIDAATAVMSQRGYSATSIQEIADQVGVLKGSLYHYFSSKEDLLFRVLSESNAEADQIKAEVAALGLEPVDELSEFLRRLSIWYVTHVDRANIFFTEGRHLTGERREVTQERSRAFVSNLESLIVRAQKEGQIRTDIDSALLARYVLGSLNNVRAWPRPSGKSFSRDAMATAFVQLTRSALQAAEPWPGGASRD